jgi:hypothetical protein
MCGLSSRMNLGNTLVGAVYDRALVSEDQCPEHASMVRSPERRTKRQKRKATRHNGERQEFTRVADKNQIDPVVQD